MWSNVSPLVSVNADFGICSKTFIENIFEDCRPQTPPVQHQNVIFLRPKPYHTIRRRNPCHEINVWEVSLWRHDMQTHFCPFVRRESICHRCHWWVSLTHDDVIKWKHLPRYWPFVRGIHRSPVNSPQRPVTRSFDVFSDLRLNDILEVWR